MAKCEVFLAVIGRAWMQNLGSTGKSRLDDPGNFVRIEIESALKRHILVIPVLVRGASIPQAKQLPDSIQDLSWGHDFDKKKCNSAESDLNPTTPITQYPNGVSPYGCYDMAGNVWEWCADRYDEARKDSCVRRGGSWYSKSESLRVSTRGLGYVDSRSYDLGFRLAQDIGE